MVIKLFHHFISDIWRIDELGKSFEPGFKMYGLLETHLNMGGEKMTLPVESVETTSEHEVCVTLPVLRYGDRVTMSQNNGTIYQIRFFQRFWHIRGGVK